MVSSIIPPWSVETVADWFLDELHPSEQTDRNIAKNFVDVLNGNGTYASYYSAP